MFTHKEINAYFATTQVPVADPGISKRRGGGAVEYLGLRFVLMPLHTFTHTLCVCSNYL